MSVKPEGFVERVDGIVLGEPVEVDFDRKGAVVLCEPALGTTLIALELDDGSQVGAFAIVAQCGHGVVAPLNPEQLRMLGAGMIQMANALDQRKGMQ